MTSAGPTANSVFVVTPQNGYPVIPGGMPQVSLYPSNQPQVHVISRSPPGLEPSVSVQPAQRALKEGKALGVSAVSLCRPAVTNGWSWRSDEVWKYRNSKSRSRVGVDPALPNSGLLESSAVQHHQGLCMGPCIFWFKHFKKEEEKQQKSSKLEHWSCCQHPCSLWKKVGLASQRVVSKPNVIEWNFCPIDSQQNKSSQQLAPWKAVLGRGGQFHYAAEWWQAWILIQMPKLKS